MSVWNWFVSVTLAQSLQEAGRQGAEQLHAEHLVGPVGHAGKEASEPGPDYDADWNTQTDSSQ
jgi:hypothetical protein